MLARFLISLFSMGLFLAIVKLGEYVGMEPTQAGIVGLASLLGTVIAEQYTRKQ